MKSKVLLIVLDGLRFDAAQTCMGYLAHLLETQNAALHKVQAELPTLSRPLYEVLLTGTSASVNGIGANDMVRLSHQQSVFHLATEAGFTTAAAAYAWFSELYNRVPFQPWRDRDQHDLTRPIQHGRFYWDDAYPDSHLLADAEMLRQNYEPDFMLVHPMGIDNAGHRYGADTKEYRASVLKIDSLLSHYVPRWCEADYTILITADHGMNADGQHGGILPDVREVPLFVLGSDIEFDLGAQPLSQLAIAPLICQLLNLAPAPAMSTASLATENLFSPPLHPTNSMLSV